MVKYVLNSNLTKGDLQSVSGNGYTVYYRKLSGNFYYICLDKTLASVGETREFTILTLPIKPIHDFIIPLSVHVAGFPVGMGRIMVATNGNVTISCTAYSNSVTLSATGIICVA